MAKVDVGDLGNVKQVQKALKSLIDKNSQETQSIKRINKVASLEIGEIGLKIRDKEKSEVSIYVYFLPVELYEYNILIALISLAHSGTSLHEDFVMREYSYLAESVCILCRVRKATFLFLFNK